MKSSSGDRDPDVVAKKLTHAGNIDVAILSSTLALGFAWVVYSGVGVLPIIGGALSWFVGVAAKAIVASLVGAVAERQFPVAKALGSGLVSASCELAAAVVLAKCFLNPGNFGEYVSFAFAAAATETAILLAEGLLAVQPAQNAEDWLKSAPRDFFIRHALLVERGGAMLMHLGTRTLVVASYFADNPFLLGLSIAVFSAVDGIADYGVGREWNWYTSTVYYYYFGFVILAGIAAFLLALQIRT